MAKNAKPPKTTGIEKMIRDEYTPKSLKTVRDFLDRHHTHDLKPNSQGIFAATGGLTHDSLSGYQNAWVRDNVMVANSFRLRGNIQIARAISDGLTKFFQKHLKRFHNIIAKPGLKEDVQQRPHIRFNAATLEELPELWAHAQNDALGYALWLRLVLANDEKQPYAMRHADWDVYGLFPRYFRAIEFWHDADSGTWEETRKINNSSVGVVVAALEEMSKHIAQMPRVPRAATADFPKELPGVVDGLLEQGREHLVKTFPFESPPQRLVDAAVLFLMHPVGIVREPARQDLILHMVKARLEGPWGIKRYIGDSYYCQDYDQWFPPEQQGGDFSVSTEYRDVLLEPGCEAQWALFDPVISVIYAERYHDTQKPEDLAQQTFYFNRSLRQLTPDGQCPELYFLQKGKFVQNDHTPLAWTQASQALALDFMERSLSRR
jgi:hypothetical protein